MKNLDKKSIILTTILTIFLLSVGMFVDRAEPTDAALFSVGSGNWDNDNFIDQTFRDAGPSTGNIIRALYGSGGEGTAYTNNRSGRDASQCDLTGMIVEYKNPGTNTIPSQLTGNTIYVLNSGNYKTSSQPSAPKLSGCSAIVGIGDVTLYSAVRIWNGYGIITAYNKKYTILDNLNIDGKWDGSGTHNANDYGIKLSSSSTNNTINNSQIYNNIKGIRLNSSTNNTINNSQIYNNDDGIYLYQAANNTINNTQIYNNDDGIYLNSSTTINNTINNTQIYNNGNGIRLVNRSTNNTINNTQIYNNNSYGVWFNGSTNNTINNTQIYNNNYGIINSFGADNTYYGIISVFGNGNNDTQLLVQGTGAYNYLGRTTGTINTGTYMSRNYLTNPINGNGSYMLNRLSPFASLRGNITRSEEILPIRYSYGGNILLQETGVVYSGTDLKYSDLPYDPGKYIGSNYLLISGSLSAIESTVTLNSNVTANYRLFGDLTADKSGIIIANISTPTGVLFSGSRGYKNIFVQFYTGNYQTTHYAIKTRFSDCASGWNNNDFIDDTFWNNDPSTGNIICALYGTGGQTAYTQNRSGRDGSQCDFAGMQVEYVGPGTGAIPQQLSGDTIYVLTGGNYINTGTINLSGCTAIVGSKDVTLYSSTGLISLPDVTMIYATGKNFIIIDYLNIDGEGDGWGGTHTGNQVGIYLYASNSNTLNNIQVYNNVAAGISLDNLSINNTLNNIKAYNNDRVGIFLYNFSSNNILNNIKAYNNDNYGISLGFSSNNTINNIQSYNNNDYGIGLSISSNNTINNIQSYNNNYGIYLDASNDNTLNNIQAYNNITGIQLYPNATGNKYYGTSYLFGNTANIGGSGENLTAGSSSDFPEVQFITGTIYTGLTLSRNYLANPLNNSGDYLLPRYTGFNNLIGQFTRDPIQPIAYSLGGQTTLQTQPIKRNTALTGLEYYGTVGNDRDTTKYIGSDLTAISGSLQGLSDYTNTGNINISLSSANTINYTLSGNFIGSPRTGTLYGSTTTGIQLSGDGYKTIILQLYTGTNRATHYGLTTTLDTTMPIFTGTTATGGIVISGGYYNTTGIQFTGSDINFSGMLLNGSPYTGLRITGDNTYTFSISDLAGNSTGITFTIDTTPPTLTGLTATGGIVISGGTYITDSVELTRYDANILGANITKDGPSYYVSTISESITLTGEGTYTATVTDKFGFSTGTTFTIVTPLSGTAILTGGTNIIQILSLRYSKDQVAFKVRTNKSNVTVTITGSIDYLGSDTFSGSLTENTDNFYNLNLSTGDGAKIFYITFTDGTQTVTVSPLLNLVRDTTKPTVTLSSPSSGQTATGTFDLGRIGTDTGVGMSGFYYFISDSLTFTNITKNGFTTSSSQTIYNYDILTSGTYYRYVQGIDMLGNTGNSETRNINYVADLDPNPDSFEFESITDADLNETYTSDTITIAGITLNAEFLATIDNGVLYINGILVGQTGYVKLGDEIKIDLISSNDYDETVTSTLTIGDIDGDFHITTEDSSDIETLSSTRKLSIAIIFNTLLDLYENNESRQLEFMIIFKNMIEDMIDDLENDDSLSTSEKRKLAVLEYLYELTTDYIDDNDISDEDMHTAPNGKKYVIVYDEDKACYTSPTFLNPNKCFPSLSEVKNYININNLAWDHTVASRSTATHIAPNGKPYTIQKTTDGRYFSYKFIAPKYFNTLADIKNYININNPRGTGR